MLCRAIVLHHNYKGIPQQIKIKNKNGLKRKFNFCSQIVMCFKRLNEKWMCIRCGPLHTFMRLLKRLHFHWFIFHQWCIDGFDLICNVWIKTLHLSIIYIILPLSVAPVSKTEPNHKCKISRSTVKVKFFLVNLFNCLKNYLLRSDCKKKKKCANLKIPRLFVYTKLRD